MIRKKDIVSWDTVSTELHCLHVEIPAWEMLNKMCNGNICFIHFFPSLVLGNILGVHRLYLILNLQYDWVSEFLVILMVKVLLHCLTNGLI